MAKKELVEEFRVFDARKGAQPLAGPKWEEMSLKALRKLADKTPGMTKKKEDRDEVGRYEQGGACGKVQSM